MLGTMLPKCSKGAGERRVGSPMLTYQTFSHTALGHPSPKLLLPGGMSPAPREGLSAGEGSCVRSCSVEHGDLPYVHLLLLQYNCSLEGPDDLGQPDM